MLNLAPCSQHALVFESSSSEDAAAAGSTAAELESSLAVRTLFEAQAPTALPKPSK
jgi:hypothetical protein